MGDSYREEIKKRKKGSGYRGVLSRTESKGSQAVRKQYYAKSSEGRHQATKATQVRLF